VEAGETNLVAEESVLDNEVLRGFALRSARASFSNRVSFRNGDVFVEPKPEVGNREMSLVRAATTTEMVLFGLVLDSRR